jgi:hypothetical protein
MADVLVSFYIISAGSIEVACDGLSALHQVVSDVSTLSIDEPCYDLLVCARHLRLFSPLSWKYHHVKGHQDAATPTEQLDISSRLNIEMDLQAKEHLQVAQRNPRHYCTINEPWSLWFSGLKINNKLDDSIYEITHSAQAREYWQRKRDLPEVIFDDIHWTALHQARKSAPLQTTTFITKHSVGMCGVGKFMVRWGKRESPECPRCGLMEDAQHVWRCNGKGADLVWETALSSLHIWLDQQGTDPDISSLLISLLESWRSNEPPSPAPFGLSHLLERQLGIGCHYLLKGWLSWEWEFTQQAYYTFTNTRRTGK